MSDISLETMRIRVTPMGDSRAVVFTLLPDGIAEPGGNESLNLELIPTPSTLQTMPIGEGVFFKHIINLTIIDANRKCSLNRNAWYTCHIYYCTT